MNTSTVTIANEDPASREWSRRCRVRDGVERDGMDGATAEGLPSAARCGACQRQPCACSFACACGWTGSVLDVHREGDDISAPYCASADVRRVWP